MTDTPETQPRIPGVRYRKVTRYRQETTTINGASETREVPFTAWEPVPPRDWDSSIIRGVTAVAGGVTLLSVAGTMASIGGLLRRMVPAPIAYGLALVFDAVWLSCLAVEWLERYDPARALWARVAGWVALAVAMSAIVAYGGSLGQWVAGAAGAAVGLLSKGLWTLVLRVYSVPLSDGIAHWMRRRREKITATRAVTAQLHRMDGQEAYLRAVFGGTADAAAAVTTGSELPRLPDPDGPRTVSAQAPDMSAASASGAAPVAPPVPAAEPSPVPAAPSASAAAPTGAGLRPVGPSIAQTIRDVLKTDPKIAHEDLVERVRLVHGDDEKLGGTVARTRRRIENPRPRRAS